MTRTRIVGFERFALQLDEFAEDLESIADEVDEAMDRAAGITAHRIEQTAKENAPQGETGELRADIAASRIRQGYWSIGTTKKYAEPTEYGSKPHPITPDTAPYLHFFWDKKGKWVKTDLVNHPGTPEQPFLRPALNKHRKTTLHEAMDEEIQKTIDKYLR